MTGGTKQYRTLDRGTTWAPFETAIPPTLGSAALSFHAQKWDWIIFTGQRCEGMGGWKGKVCKDEVRISVPRSGL